MIFCRSCAHYVMDRITPFTIGCGWQHFGTHFQLNLWLCQGVSITLTIDFENYQIWGEVDSIIIYGN